MCFGWLFDLVWVYVNVLWLFGECFDWLMDMGEVMIVVNEGMINEQVWQIFECVVVLELVLVKFCFFLVIVLGQEGWMEDVVVVWNMFLDGVDL